MRTACRYLSRTGRVAFGFAVVASLCMSAPARAQNTTFNVSTSQTPDTFTDTTLPTLVAYNYQTRVIGLLQGDPTLYYDETFAFQFSDPEVQAGVAAAQAALTAASSDPLSFVGPTLQSSSSSLASSETLTTQIGDPIKTETIGFGEWIGPTSHQIDDLGLCSGLVTDNYQFPFVLGPASVKDYPMGCVGGTGGVFDVEAGTSDFTANVNYQFHFIREIQTTDTFDVFETWKLLGVPEGESSVPEPGTLGLVGGGLFGLAWARRLRTRR